MIEFGVKRASKGKRSRWSKKFPRKKILHRGDEKYYNWYPNNWDGTVPTVITGGNTSTFLDLSKIRK